MQLRRLPLICALLMVLLSAAIFVRATCNPADTGTAGSDTIVCDVANQPAGDVVGQDGDDTIYVGAGVVTSTNISGGNTVAVAESGNDTIVNDGTIIGPIMGDSGTGAGSGDDTIVNNGLIVSYIHGDSSDGNGSGDDAITNNGTVNGGIVGDTGGSSDGSGGDVIINNGSVTGDILGDAYLGDGSGSDTITNNGTVSSLYGDAFLGDGSGSDTITNNGTVSGTIFGDNYPGAGSGNDTITNNGTVGDDIIAGGGNDTVILQAGSAQVDGIINGGSGYDVLTFNLSSANPAELQAWAEQIAAANPAGGALTFSGHTYTWVNFEELTQLLFSLVRINDLMDPLAVFCALSGGVDVYSVSGGAGTFSLNVSQQTIANGLAQAVNGRIQLAASSTATVYALPTGELQVTHPGGFSFSFTFQTYCGTLPPASESEPTVDEEELAPFTIINQPYSG
ncbi:MAG: calcium-binding protein [Anaerolineae bacterium]